MAADINRKKINVCVFENISCWLLLQTYSEQLKVPACGSLRNSSYSRWMPERWSRPRWVSSSCGRMDSGPGMWTEVSSTGIPTSSSTGSMRSFWPASSCWFQLVASRGSRPPRCWGRQSLGRCLRSSSNLTIWTWTWVRDSWQTETGVMSDSKEWWYPTTTPCPYIQQGFSRCTGLCWEIASVPLDLPVLWASPSEVDWADCRALETTQGRPRSAPSLAWRGTLPGRDATQCSTTFNKPHSMAKMCGTRVCLCPLGCLVEVIYMTWMI